MPRRWAAGPPPRWEGSDIQLLLRPLIGSGSTCRCSLIDVHVSVAPVASASALVWIGYARGALDDAVAAAEVPPVVDPDLETHLRGLLDSWEVSALEGPTLCLSFDFPSDMAQALIHAFLRVADRLTIAADQRGFDVSPPEGDEFYTSLVEAVITALERAEDPSSVEFGTALRSAWPRTDRVERPDGADQQDDGSTR